MESARVLQKLQAAPEYQANLHWGKPRWGHPEGSLAAHIAELEANLQLVRGQLQAGEEDRLRLIIHVHDICKPQAQTGVPSDHEANHAFLARTLLARFSGDEILLGITQHHDDGFFLYNNFRHSRDLSRRIAATSKAVGDIELYLIFLLVDGCTAGKFPGPLDWYLQQIAILTPLTARIVRCRELLTFRSQ